MPDSNSIPDLKRFIERRVQIKLKGGRTVTGILRGVDPFMNVVLHDAADESNKSTGDPLPQLGETVVRGNVIVDIVTLQA
jgi:small nuclear ribonucleoprotein G